MSQPAPRLSVVLRVIAGPDAIERCVAQLRAQAGEDAIEIIVPVAADAAAALSAGCRAAAIVLPIRDDELPDVSLASRIHFRCDLGTARGFAIASADIVASLEDTAVLPDRWVEALLTAHAQSPDEAIGGAVDVAAEDEWGWAAFWLDFWRLVPPIVAGPAAALSDVNVSYKRKALVDVEPVWRDGFNEFVLHRALQQRGFRLRLLPAASVVVRRPRRPPRAVLAERFDWGRVFGVARRRSEPAWRAAVQVLLSPLLPLWVTLRLLRRAASRPAHRALTWRGALPLLICAVAWCAGETVGVITGSAGPPPRHRI